VNETNQPGTRCLHPESAAGRHCRGCLAAAEAKAQENWNSYLRAVAELDNYRKRTEREIDNARKFAIERFAQELLRSAMRWRPASRPGAAIPARPCSRAPRRPCKELHRAFDKAGIKIIDP
jgi:molecular chaperone GrpE